MNPGLQWIRYTDGDGQAGFGVLEAERVREYQGELFGEHQATGRVLACGALQIDCPCAPSKVIALWNNYRALAEKLGKSPPAHPLFLIKPATSVVGPDQGIRRPALYRGKVVYEGELGIVIGRRCANVGEQDAARYIFGYTCVNDVTAIELLDENPDFAQWTRAKSADTFCCLGPAIATELDWASARVVTTVDGVERQNYPLSDMILHPARIVSSLSADLTLLPGDVIACGTSLGVGSLKEGSIVIVRIDGVGELRNRFGP